MAEELSFEEATRPANEVSFEEATKPREVSFEDAIAPQLSAAQKESLAARAGHYLRDNPVSTAILGPSDRTRLAEGIPNPETGALEYKPLAGEATRTGALPAAVATAMKPIQEIPRVEEVPASGFGVAKLRHIGDSAVAAAKNTGIGIANALQSPAGVAALAFPEARVAMGGYMALHAPSDTADAYKAFKEGRTQEGLEKSVQAMLDVGGAADARAHGLEAARSVLPREVVDRPDAKQIVTRMAEEQQTLRADDAARDALRPENAQRTAENPAITSERARQQAVSDVALERQNQSEVSTGPAVQPFEDAFTPIDQLYAERKYGVGPERRVIDVPGGMLDQPEFANKTEAAYRNESEKVARATKESGVEEPVESKPVTPLPTDELSKANELTPSTKLKTSAEAARERVRATLEADSAIRDAAGCL